MKGPVQPSDFLGEQPPERIIGLESECNVQHDLGVHELDYLSIDAIKSAGYSSTGEYLDNGMRVYADCSHLEICTGEMLGPRQAAAADAASIIVLNNIVESSGVSHRGVYRHAGTAIGDAQQTSGYHENYLVPLISFRDESMLTETVISSHLATRLYSFAGMVDSSGFRISQKVSGIGGVPITADTGRRTKHGDKPMVLMRSANLDRAVIGETSWRRLEVRFADPGFSLLGRYLTFATTSLVLRLIEHGDKIDIEKLAESGFVDPVSAAQQFSYDLTFTDTAETISGKRMSAIDFQELLAEQTDRLGHNIELPEDEVDAIPLWFDVCDQFRQANLNEGEYARLGVISDFAPRHRYLARNINTSVLNSNNPATVEANLVFDQITPRGGGMIYWDTCNEPITNELLRAGSGEMLVNVDDVEYFVNEAPNTRAALRSAFIHLGASAANWSNVTRGKRNISLSDPYEGVE